jgi:hypothetical protein
VGGVSDDDIQARIKGLIEQEHDLRQRRARREFGQDPDEAAVRDAGTVENYRG